MCDKSWSGCELGKTGMAMAVLAVPCPTALQYRIYWHSGAFDVIWLHTTSDRNYATTRLIGI